MRYDRDLNVPASLWEGVVERTSSTVVTPISQNGFGMRLLSLFSVPTLKFSLASVAALILIALGIGFAYVQSRKTQQHLQTAGVPQRPADRVPKEEPAPENDPQQKMGQQKQIVVKQVATARRSSEARPPRIDSSDVLSSDLGFQDMDDKDTAKHLEQTQNLLRSIRNVRLNDGDQEIDVTYDKAVSRRLLSENIVLRRDAEMKAKFPTKTLLSDLEPFLLDIANLPDQAKPEEVRAIKERVQKTEIVAALIGYY